MRARGLRKYEGWFITGFLYLLAALSVFGMAVEAWALQFPKGKDGSLSGVPSWVTMLSDVGFGTYLTVLAVVISFYAIYMQVRETHRINKFNQSVVATMHCNSRYDEIVQDQPLNMAPAKAKDEDLQAAKKHWRRYWGLKADQFDLYLTGLVDRDTMAGWQLSIINHFLRHLEPGAAAPGGVNAVAGWEQQGRSQNEANLWFSQLIEVWLAKARELHALTPAERARQKPQDLLLYVVEQLACIEPVVKAWNNSSHRGNMSLAFYKASLAWSLFAASPPLARKKKKRLEKLKAGIAIKPNGVILKDRA